MTTQTIVKNGKIVLPSIISQAWEKSEVLIYPKRNSILIKKIQKSFKNLSELAKRTSSKKLSPSVIQKEIEAFRENK